VAPIDVHEKCAYYRLVPKEYRANLKWRRRCLELGYKNVDYSREFWILCSRDILFWVNTFGYTYDPRKKGSTVVPFITYAYQDDTILELADCVERGVDVLIEKSRDMGVTWMALVVLIWYWQFRRYQSFRLVSRVEDLVDKSEDPDSLMWKMDFFIKHQPMWLAPRAKANQIHRTHLHAKNRQTESMIDGASTTGDVARGGRCRALMMDEFAAVPNDQEVLSSIRDVTDCRIFISTHKGTSTAFYRLTKTPIKKLRLHWTLHPSKRAGLYRYNEQTREIEILDKDFTGYVKDVSGNVFKFPDDYPFRKDNRIRSPWYDVQCDRASHPMEIAQELDIDPFSSDFQFFDPEVIDSIESRDVRDPIVRGELEYDGDSLMPIRFTPNPKGKLQLWCSLDENNRFPADIKTAFGIDVSAGTGASNSTISVGDRVTHEKIAEFASPDIKPEEFARYTYALAHFFNQSYIVWDGGGAGRIFGDTLVKLGYRNIYYRRREDSLDKKTSLIPGCFLNPKEKLAVLGAYRRDLKDGQFIQRSLEANRECLQYVFTTANTVEHAAAKNAIDPSGASANHGDRVIADALLNRAYASVSIETVKIEEDENNDYTFAARRKEWERRNLNQDTWY
jgi:hypothetical protein